MNPEGPFTLYDGWDGAYHVMDAHGNICLSHSYQHHATGLEEKAWMEAVVLALNAAMGPNPPPNPPKS